MFFGILLLSIACYPLIISLASLIIFPLEYGLKTRIVFKAKRKVKQCPNLKVIGITGSYGKTSVKSCLNLLLKDSFEVIAPIGTHNTLLGISQFILKELKPTTQIMIVEMGAYVPGDIKELCDIVNPQYAILTGITLQHLERFGSLDRIIQTKFEITQNLKSDSFLFVDGENENIQKGIERYAQNAPYQREEIAQLPVRYAPDFQGISFIYQGTEYTTKLLGKHTAKNLSLAIAVALKL